MSVIELDTIDFVRHQQGELVLTIADHLPFDDENHLDLLQAKLNCYLAYIESEAFEEKFPESITSDVVIEIVFQSPPSGWADDFLEYCQEQLEAKGILFRWKQAPEARRGKSAK